MPKAASFADRIKLMVERVGSARALEPLIGKSRTAIIKWKNGADAYAKTKREIAAHSGLTLAWLEGGAGEDEAELSKLTFPRKKHRAGESTRSLESDAVAHIMKHGTEDDRRLIRDTIELIARRDEKRRTKGGGTTYAAGSE